MKAPETIKLEAVGYEVTGEVFVVLWDGSRGKLEMEPTTLPFDTELTEDLIVDCINDGGYGVLSITEAEVDVYAIYGKGYRELVECFRFAEDAVPQFDREAYTLT